MCFARAGATGGPALALKASMIERKEEAMRVAEAQTKKGPRGRLMVAVMSLALFAGALPSLGGSSSRRAASTDEAARTDAARFTSPEVITPGEAIADRDVLELQLD